jgi:cobalamin biosynthesis protein CbiD
VTCGGVALAAAAAARARQVEGKRLKVEIKKPKGVGPYG